MAIGTISELILIGHYESAWQLLPIILISLALILFLVISFRKLQVLSRLFGVLMLLCVVAGIIGFYLHLNANMEFAAEMRPTLSRWSIFLSSFSGAIPALAPGSLIAFGIIGYAYNLLLSNKNEIL